MAFPSTDDGTAPIPGIAIVMIVIVGVAIIVILVAFALRARDPNSIRPPAYSLTNDVGNENGYSNDYMIMGNGTFAVQQPVPATLK